VFLQEIPIAELFAADVARKQLSSVMNVHVADGVVQILKPFVALSAHQRFVMSMNMHMVLKIMRVNERLTAQSARKSARACVHFELDSARKLFLAENAEVRLFHQILRVFFSMALEIRQTSELLFAQLARKRPLDFASSRTLTHVRI